MRPWPRVSGSVGPVEGSTRGKNTRMAPLLVHRATYSCSEAILICLYPEQQVPPPAPEGAAGGGIECVMSLFLKCNRSDHKQKYIDFCLSTFKYVFSDVYVMDTSKNTKVFIFLSCFHNFLVIFVYYTRLDPRSTYTNIHTHTHTPVLTAQNGYKKAAFKV